VQIFNAIRYISPRFNNSVLPFGIAQNKYAPFTKNQREIVSIKKRGDRGPFHLAKPLVQDDGHEL
jgi:hypothetical protein